jgi:hypothetical protein
VSRRWPTSPAGWGGPPAEVAEPRPTESPVAPPARPPGSAVVWLKRALIAAWALWLTVVTASNVCDWLRMLGHLDPAWAFVSGNYAAVQKAMALYGLPAELIDLTFLAVIGWQAVATLLLWWAAARFAGGGRLGPVYVAFAVFVGLWLAFLVMDEVFLQYTLEDVHRQLVQASLLSLLAIALLPE